MYFFIVFCSAFLPFNIHTREDNKYADNIWHLENEHPAITSDGTLACHYIPTLLAQLESQRAIHEDFKDPDNLQASNILPQIGETGGYFTRQLFKVRHITSNRYYILREMSSGLDEARRLICGKAIPQLRSLHLPTKHSDCPCFVFPYAFFVYEHNGITHIVSIMPHAPGIQLSWYMKRFKKNPDEHGELKRAYYYLGCALARFQQCFAAINTDFNQLTPAHGDLHHHNIFFDPTTSQITFIDNEHVAYFFIHRRRATHDIVNFFDETLGPTITRPTFYENFNTTAWIQITLSSFLSGYLSIFRPGMHRTIVKSIKKAFIYKETGHQQYQKYQAIFDEIFAHYTQIID